MLVQLYLLYDQYKDCLLHFLFAVLSQDTFYFSSKPEDMDVIEGSEVLLRCDVSNRHHIMFSWAHNNKPLVPTSRRFQEGSHLHILRVTREEDSGVFSCIATNKTSGYSLVSEASLNIQCKYQKYTHGFICISLSSIKYSLNTPTPPFPSPTCTLHPYHMICVFNLQPHHSALYFSHEILLLLTNAPNFVIWQKVDKFIFLLYLFLDSIMQSCTQQVSEN